jgi:D-tyrosyl-tRNA(Tyr) deacylase
MRVVIQRVSEASVTIAGEVVGEIGRGLMVLAGFEDSDEEARDLRWIAGKLSKLRVFPDDQNVMNRSVTDVGGELLIVSQFTLHADTKKGNRPSYRRAAGARSGEALYDRFLEILAEEFSGKMATGRFGADMRVALVNDGPVTIIIDSQNRE